MRTSACSLGRTLTGMQLLLYVSAAALGSGPHFGRRTALSIAVGGQPLIASAASPIEKGAPAFGTRESRTGLLDGIKSAFSERSGEELAAEYARKPVDTSGVSLPSALTKAKDVAIIFHGSGGPDRETADVLSRFRAQDKAAGLDREVIVYNWMPWFTADTDRLSFQSASVGASLGKALAGNRELRSLHIIGTSAGSFAADACSSSYVTSAGGTAGSGRAAVRLTLADPFAAKDGASFKSGRGAQFFGKDADFAEHFLNTDDIVPNTKGAHRRPQTGDCQKLWGHMESADRALAPRFAQCHCRSAIATTSLGAQSARISRRPTKQEISFTISS